MSKAPIVVLRLIAAIIIAAGGSAIGGGTVDILDLIYRVSRKQGLQGVVQSLRRDKHGDFEPGKVGQGIQGAHAGLLSASTRHTTLRGKRLIRDRISNSPAEQFTHAV